MKTTRQEIRSLPLSVKSQLIAELHQVALEALRRSVVILTEIEPHHLPDLSDARHELSELLGQIRHIDKELRPAK